MTFDSSYAHALAMIKPYSFMINILKEDFTIFCCCSTPPFKTQTIMIFTKCYDSGNIDGFKGGFLGETHLFVAYD